MQKPFLSIIIPAYNEESRLPDTLSKVESFLKEQIYSSEVWVVDNNSTDQTAKIIREYANRYSNIKGLFEEKPGKGDCQTGVLNNAFQNQVELSVQDFIPGAGSLDNSEFT